MDRIWAPWRMDYIESSKEPGCVFCEKSQSKKDKKNLVLYRGMETFILMNLYPYTNGHLMIAPYLHTSDVNELAEIANKEIMQFAKDCFNILKISSDLLFLKSLQSSLYEAPINKIISFFFFKDFMNLLIKK